jgi:putative membrane protein
MAATALPMTRTAAAATDLLVGVAAGLVAALAMNAFQSAWTRLADAPEVNDTAASRAASAVSEEVSGEPLKPSVKKSADSVVHYLTGAAAGGFYGLVGGLFPRLMWGRGLLFGGVCWLLGDEIAVPAMRLGPPPGETEPEDHVLALCSHMVFGAVLDLTRRVLNLAVSAERPY